MIKVEAARKIILESIKTLGKERVDLRASLNRILAEDIISPNNIPPFNNSAMDGFALHASDTPRVLELIENLKAGDIPSKKVKAGQASRIMTGAKIPDGADAVIKVEDTKQQDANKIEIMNKAKKGENIRMAGEDVRKGELILSKGVVIRPQELGMLAAVGRSSVSVYRKPKVAILATGDELLDVGEKMRAGKIRSSNSYTLFGQVIKSGGEAIDLGIVGDDRKKIIRKLRSGLRADMIITSGGVSVGDYDLVKDVLAELGIKMKFWQVAMKPGKPIVFGLISGKPVFGLPGNPVSSMVTFEEFVRPAILKMSGRNKLYKSMITAILLEQIRKESGKKHFIRGEVLVKNGNYFVKTTGPQGSGMLRSMIRANSFIILDENIKKLRKGERVKVEMMAQSEIE